METELNYDYAMNEFIFISNNTVLDRELLMQHLEPFDLSADTSVYYDQTIGLTTSNTSAEEMTVIYIDEDVKFKHISPLVNDGNNKNLFQEPKKKKKTRGADNQLLLSSDELDEHLKQFTVRR